MPRFSFAFEPRYRLVDRAFGVTPASTWVELTDDTFEARFGPWRHPGLTVTVAEPEALVDELAPLSVGSSRPEFGSRR